MKSEKSAGLIYGPNSHHLDHLGPLCSLLKIPLIVIEEPLADLAKKYYPDLQVIYFDYLEVHPTLVKDFDKIFYCFTRHFFEEAFAFWLDYFGKKIKTIWCPHGNSDKGQNTYFMEALEKEDHILIYGSKMYDFLKQKGVFDKISSYSFVGNYRYQYYLKNKEFYDGIIKAEVKKNFPSNKKTILYAPTWKDHESSSSFESAFEIIANLSNKYNLIIKLHPNTWLENPIETEKIQWKYENKNILFLKDFTPIYPLLDYVNIYIGDMSSIGYDFLLFDKPMFFLNENSRNSKKDSGLFLYQAGVEIKPSEYSKIPKKIQTHDQKCFSSIREKIYNYTFREEKNWQQKILSYET